MTKSFTNMDYKIPPPKNNGKIALRNQEKVNMFVDTLIKIFRTNRDVDTNFTDSTEQAVTECLNQLQQASVRPTNQSEIEQIIHHLKPRKAPDPDGIQNIEHGTPTMTSPQIY